MELSRRLTHAQRATAALLAAAVGAVAWLESRSPAAAAARGGAPFVGLIALQAPPAAPQLFAAVYQPARRTLDLIYLPETTALPHGKTLAQAYAGARRAGAGDVDAAKAMAAAAAPALEAAWPQTRGSWDDHFYYDEAAHWDHEAPLSARRWLVDAVQGAGFWRAAARRLARAGPDRGMGPFELFRLGYEFHNLAPTDLRVAWLADPADRPAHFARLLGESPKDADERAITVEVLNASGIKGIASAATKILRSKGADVVSTGNAPEQAHTVAYDRTGRPDSAARVIQMLGCGSAQAVTQIDAKRLVDVSVVIAGDCD